MFGNPGAYSRNVMKHAGAFAALIIPFLLGAQVSNSARSFMREMETGLKQMDTDMASAAMNGQADHDFAAMMIPHHQGAIEMAKAELRYGTDEVMRRLAEEILVDQQSEIDAMNLWLDKRAASLSPNGSK
jgi:uncharacterized protein (DUF305 family)